MAHFFSSSSIIIMGDEQLSLLNKRFLTLEYRMKILYFHVISYRMNGRLKFLLNERGSFHLNDCDWSRKNPVDGPDTCHCHIALDSPEEFLENRIRKRSKFPLNAPADTLFLKQSQFEANEEENVQDFYFLRVLDFENASRWHEEYKKKTNALRFQIKVRELNKQHEIDAVFNSESKEFHLTDCIRSLKCHEGPDVCHCSKAMTNPWKYLKNTYHYLDLKKIRETYSQTTKPIRFVQTE